MTTPITGTSGAASAQSPERAKLKQAAQQFEAVLMRQMLAEARKADFGSDAFSGQGVSTFREMMDSRMADVASQNDSLGLARMIENAVGKLLPKVGGA